MPNIPTGQYKHPGGILLVREGENYSAIVKFIPRSHEIPDKVTAFLWYFNDDDFDGSEIEFYQGLTEKEAEALPPEYRYEGDEWGAPESYEIDLEDGEESESED